MRQRLGLTVSGAAASSLMKPVNLERSQTILPFSSLMTPSSGNRAIRPRFAFAKSALSDHGSEAVAFLLNSSVDGDAGLPAVCAWAIEVANPRANPAATTRKKYGVKAPSADRRPERVVCVNVALLYYAMTLSRLIAVVSSPVHTEQTARIRTVGADRMHHTQSGAALFGAAFWCSLLCCRLASFSAYRERERETM